MFQFKQSEATADRRRIFFYAVDATDGYTAVTASITSGVVLIVKNGNTPGTSPAGPTFTHISNGLWYYEMTASHLDTQGVVSVTITGSNIRTVQLIGYVYSGDPMAAIPTFPTNFSSLAITGTGAVTAGTVGDKTGYSLAAGAITSTTFGADAITASVIANGAIDAATFADSALVIGSAAGTGVKAYLGAGSITAGVVATGAIDADAIASAAITSAKFAADAITASVIANGAIDAATFANDAITAAVIANGAIDAATFATGAINAAAIAADALTSAKFADGALIIGATTGTGVKISHGVNSITAGVIADAAIDAATFADSALVIGSAAAGGVKAYLGAGSITAGVIATNAIDADAIATDAIDSDAIANSAITIRMSGDGTPSEGRIIAGSIASDVWNAASASYNTAGTFGKLMDTLKKANFVIEGTTTTGSTTTSINTGLTGYLTDAFDNQTILFISGALAGTSSLIITSSSGGGVFTLEQALPAAPASGVDFVVLGTHVHGNQEIANTVWTTDISGISLSGQAGRYITDIKVDTTNIASSASTIEGTAYRESVADILLGRNLAGGSNTGRLVKEALFALRNKSEIVGSTLNVYDETDGGIAWSASVASSAGANPVTGIDPT